MTDMKKPEKLARIKAIKYKTHQLWLRVVDTIKRRHIALECIFMIESVRQQSYWIITDDKGSGFDTRYVDISWMDTR